MQATQTAQTKPARYLALDTFRGFIMLALAAEGFGFPALRNHPVWGTVAHWFQHVPWDGAVFWDMIQPSFMFMVGVAMPFAFAKRSATEGQKHVWSRALKLILVGQLLCCVSSGYIRLQLITVLCQIAFTYTITYYLLKLRWRWQLLAGLGLMAFWMVLLHAFPGPDGPYSRRGHIGLVVDRWIFHYDYDPAYSTLNFLASTMWTLAGAWAGQLLMRPGTHKDKLKPLAGGMLAAFAASLVLSIWIPMIKQLCTPSFVFYSLGWVLFMLIGFYLVIEVANLRRWTFPLVVIGANSLFIYSFAYVLYGWLDQAVGVFTFHYKWIGTFAPVFQSCTVVLVMWYLCYWLYQRKIFLKL